MSLIVLANSCNNGPCPTFYLNPTEDVIIQAIKITDPGDRPQGMPAHEDAVRIPRDAWQRLLTDLPWRQLALAMAGRLARRWRAS